jgi:hypothetical protein
VRVYDAEMLWRGVWHDRPYPVRLIVVVVPGLMKTAQARSGLADLHLPSRLCRNRSLYSLKYRKF